MLGQPQLLEHLVDRDRALGTAGVGGQPQARGVHQRLAHAEAIVEDVGLRHVADFGQAQVDRVGADQDLTRARVFDARRGISAGSSCPTRWRRSGRRTRPARRSGRWAAGSAARRRRPRRRRPCSRAPRSSLTTSSPRSRWSAKGPMPAIASWPQAAPPLGSAARRAARRCASRGRRSSAGCRGEARRGARRRSAPRGRRRCRGRGRSAGGGCGSGRGGSGPLRSAVVRAGPAQPGPRRSDLDQGVARTRRPARGPSARPLRKVPFLESRSTQLEPAVPRLDPQVSPGDPLVVERDGAGGIAADLERRLERQPQSAHFDLPPIDRAATAVRSRAHGVTDGYRLNASAFVSPLDIYMSSLRSRSH